MPEASKSNNHGFIHGRYAGKPTTPEVLKSIKQIDYHQYNLHYILLIN